MPSSYDPLSKVYSFVWFLQDSMQWLLPLCNDERFYLFRLFYELRDGRFSAAPPAYKLQVFHEIINENATVFEIWGNLI